jgi:hypothetical protein
MTTVIEAVENCVLAAFADAGLQCGEIRTPFGVEHNRLAVNDRVAARELGRRCDDRLKSVAPIKASPRALGPDFADSLPEAKRAVDDQRLWRPVEPTDCVPLARCIFRLFSTKPLWIRKF